MTRLKSRPTDYTAMEANHTVKMSQGSKDGVVVTAATVVVPGESVYTQVDVERARDEACGWGPLRPPCCQRLRTPVCVLVCLCCASAVQGIVVNGFVNVVISNIEKRFEISSTESGIIASSYDIASVLCMIPVTYFGGLGMKPRYVGVGIFILGVGSLVFSLPHFTTGPYSVSLTTSELCAPGQNQTSLCDSRQSDSLSQYKYVFFLGQLLHGAGASPLYTLGVNYLDENLPPHTSTFYVGIFYALAIVGPAIGYVAGGEFLKMHTDIGVIDTSKLTYGPTNPRWVGAWWIGFLITGFIAFVISVPISGFPRSLPGSCKYHAERNKEVYVRKGNENAAQKLGKKKGIKDLLLSVKLLLQNPTFMFLNFAAATEGILLSGFSTFGPKFIEAQFSLPSSSAAQYIGFAAIPAGGGGTFLGGYLVKRFNLKMNGILRLCMVSCAIAFLSIFVFFVNCKNVPFAGVNVKYGEADDKSEKVFVGGKLDDTCNSWCKCSENEYLPVCGKDGIQYFSPCYAGCSEGNLEKKKYSNCSCISFVETEEEPFSAKFGKCESSCNLLPVFMPFFILTILFTFLSSMPALSATLRCLPDTQRAVGLGIQWIIARCLGSIPGPILFGKMIDLTCELWQKRCNDNGSCFFYNNRNMSYNLLALGLVLKFLSFVLFFLAFVLYRSPSDKSHNDNDDDGGKKTEEISLSSRTTLASHVNVTPTMDGQRNGEISGPAATKAGAADRSSRSDKALEAKRHGDVPAAAAAAAAAAQAPRAAASSSSSLETRRRRGHGNSPVASRASCDLCSSLEERKRRHSVPAKTHHHVAEKPQRRHSGSSKQLVDSANQSSTAAAAAANQGSTAAAANQGSTTAAANQASTTAAKTDLTGEVVVKQPGEKKHRYITVSPKHSVSSPKDAVPSPKDSVPSPKDSVPSPKDSVSSPKDAVPSPKDSVSSPKDAVTTLLIKNGEHHRLDENIKSSKV